MKKTLSIFTTLLIFAGCNPAPTRVTISETNTPEIETTADQPIIPDNSNVTPTSSKVNATELLSETLALAKKENKRVMVHLGATW